MSSADEIKALAASAAEALRAKNHKEAIDLASKILKEDSEHAGALAVKFSSLFELQRFEQARRMGTLTAQRNPNSEFILNNQACLQLEAKQPAAAVGLLRSLMDQFGERAQWLYNMALAQRMVGNFSYAVATFRRTLDLEPTHDRAAFQLADCLNSLGMKSSAVRAFEYVRLLRSKHAQTQSNYIHQAVNDNQISADELRVELALWRKRFIPQDKLYTIKNIENSAKINIGFLIGKLPDHWLTAIVSPVIAEFARRDHNITVYWHNETLSQNQFLRSVNVVESARFTDADFTRSVRSNGTEILVDVCGMRLGSRQRPLALRTGSKQFGWLAHEGIYASDHVTPIESLFTEPCYAAQLSATDTEEKESEKLLFGIGCREGLSDEVIKAWAAVLHACEDWQLQLDCTDRQVINTLQTQFQNQGIASDRLKTQNPQSVFDNAIVLDNFIQNDPVATISALQKGGIIVALQGALFPATHTQHILQQAGRPDWLVTQRAEYIQRAINLTQNCDAKPLSEDEFAESKLNDIENMVTQLLEKMCA